MANLSPRPGPALRTLAIALAVAVLGLGARWVWAPAAVGVTFVATFMAFGGVMTFNAISTRLLFQAVAAAHGVAIYLGSGSFLLAAAASLPIVLMLPGDFLVGRLGYKSGVVLPLLSMLGLGLFAAAWPTGVWGWAAAPGLLLVAYFAVVVNQGMVAMNRQVTAWPLERGQPVANFRSVARDGSEFELAREQGRWLLLCFLRGDWCPVCQVMMRIYQRESALLARHGVKLVAVTPIGGQDAVDFARELGIDYTILVDEGSRIARQFGAIDPKADPSARDSMLPASFLIDGKGILRASSRPDDIAGFYSPQKVLEQIELLSRAA